MNRQPSTSARSLTLASALTALSLPLDAAVAELVRIGAEFQVNTYTTSYQFVASVAADADGDFIVVWWSGGQDGSAGGIFGQRFSSTGQSQAAEFQVNTFTLYHQFIASVAADADGDFVVAWSDNRDTGDVFVRRFSSAGQALAVEFMVNTQTVGQQAYPAVAADADGDFVVAWENIGYGVFAHRFSSSGLALGAEFQVDTSTGSNQKTPSVAADADGDFVVVWQGYFQDGSEAGVFARRFSSGGQALGAEFQVNSYTEDQQRYPSVAVDASGVFVVAWASTGQDGSSDGVFARRFSGTGQALAAEFQVNTHTASDQTLPKVAMDNDGHFVVTWASRGQDGSYMGSPSLGVFGRRFSSAGQGLASEFQVNTHTLSHQTGPALAMEAGGDFVVAWSSLLQDGDDLGVFAQRFGIPPITLDIDGNGTTDALSDGLLVVRYLFGFRGSTLVTGAVGQGCARCEALSIEVYLGGLGLVLDVDGNGSTDALTDGLLVLRYLFGFRGDALITGAVGPGCVRCDAATIEDYIAERS